MPDRRAQSDAAIIELLARMLADAAVRKLQQKPRRAERKAKGAGR